MHTWGRGWQVPVPPQAWAKSQNAPLPQSAVVVQPVGPPLEEPAADEEPPPVEEPATDEPPPLLEPEEAVVLVPPLPWAELDSVPEEPGPEDAREDPPRDEEPAADEPLARLLLPTTPEEPPPLTVPELEEEEEEDVSVPVVPVHPAASTNVPKTTAPKPWIRMISPRDGPRPSTQAAPARTPGCGG